MQKSPRPGIEPGPPGWKPGILTPRPSGIGVHPFFSIIQTCLLFSAFLRFDSIVCLSIVFRLFFWWIGGSRGGRRLIFGDPTSPIVKAQPEVATTGFAIICWEDSSVRTCSFCFFSTEIGIKRGSYGGQMKVKEVELWSNLTSFLGDLCPSKTKFRSLRPISWYYSIYSHFRWAFSNKVIFFCIYIVFPSTYKNNIL